MVGTAGNASYASGVFAVNGAGGGQLISGSSDAFHFVYQPLSGDGSIIARVASLTSGAQAGVMVRQTLDPGSITANVTDWSPYVYFDTRTTAGAGLSWAGDTSGATPPYWLQLARSGSTFTTYIAPDGVTWTQVGSSETISMTQNVYVGLAVTSSNTTALATATFDNLSTSFAPEVLGPSITNLSPAAALPGAAVTITGNNFGAGQGSSSVTFNATLGTPTGWSATTIVVPVPSGVTSGNVIVTVNGMASTGVPFTVLQVPSITSLSATSATIGASVTIIGTNFGSAQGTSTVMFNGVTATPTSWTPSSIVTPVPFGATTGNVIVTVNGLSSNAVPISITLLSLPSVSTVLPANESTGFPLNGRVIVRFAQAVQPIAFIAGAFTVSQGGANLTGNLTFSDDGLWITFTPSQSLTLEQLPLREATMVLIDAVTALRASELVALKWRNVGWGTSILRSEFAFVEGELKDTKSRNNALPLGRPVLNVLRLWREHTPYRSDEDWIFASPHYHGKTPYTYQILFRRHIQPVIERVSNLKSSKQAPIGWHTLRRSLATLLISNGENVKVAQSQLRHTTPKITLELYAQAVSADQQKAHKKVIQMVLPAKFPEKLKARSAAPTA